jgi:thioredoxin reductase (NADPH)
VAEARYEVIVIGEGVSGLTAAGKLAAAGLKAATFEANLFGGLVINVNELEPVPDGMPHSGAELASELMQANAEAGVESVQEPVTSIDVSGAL